MNPSVGLAALLLAAASPPSFAQAPDPAALCAIKVPAAPVPGNSPPVAAAAPAPAADPSAPFDASAEKLDPAAWTKLGAAGDRLDPKTCRVLAADGHALTRREIEALTGEKPAAKDARAERDRKGLAGAGAAAAGLDPLGGANGEDAARTFDGGARGGPGTDAAGTGSDATGGGSSLGKLATSLTAGYVDLFSREEAGRALLANLAGPDGKPNLPPLALADLGGGAVPALYDRPSKTILIDRKGAAQTLVAAAPEGERKALARQLDDPERLAAYLLARPDARQAVLAATDETVFHESVHAWQQRRDVRVDAVEKADTVECEREAYRDELQYYHEKLMRDPGANIGSDDMTLYRTMLAGYPGFKTDVTQLYVNNNGSTDLPTIEQALAQRAKKGRPGAADALSGAKRLETEYAARETDFAATVVKEMQAQAYPRLIAYDLSQGHPADALSLSVEAPAAIRRAQGPAAFTATEALLRGNPPAPIADRLKSWDAYIAYQDAADGKSVLPADLYALYQRDQRAAFDDALARAVKASNAEDRKEALAWARTYAEALPDERAELSRRLTAVSGGR